MDFTGIPTRYHKKKLEKRLKNAKTAVRTTKKTKLLQNTLAGFIEKEDGERVTQNDIINAADVGVATKRFEMRLKGGPYTLDYSSSGRHLALCGSQGHVGMLDWMTKKLNFEMDVHETCHAVKFLHQETMIAVAQKHHTFIYDNQGVELHCMKKLNFVTSMQFLPYHFLLATFSSKGYISWLDITTGDIVADMPTFIGYSHATCLNPANAVFCIGQRSGAVSMWTPNEKKSVVKLLCHHTPIEAVSVDRTGTYMATAGQDHRIKVWDLRSSYQELASMELPAPATSLDFSQQGLLAAASGPVVQMFREPHLGGLSEITAFQPVAESVSRKTVFNAYLSYYNTVPVRKIQFCPFEDVLGIGSTLGFSSILCPGAGEPNFDAMEENPFASKKHRQEREVRRLMDKIPSELIALDTLINRVHKEDIADEWERKRSALLGEVAAVAPTKIKRNRKKGRSKAGKVEMRKSTVRLERKMLEVNKMLDMRKELGFDEVAGVINSAERAAMAEIGATETWKRPSDVIASKKNLKKRRIKTSLDVLIPKRKEAL